MSASPVVSHPSTPSELVTCGSPLKDTTELRFQMQLLLAEAISHLLLHGEHRGSPWPVTPHRTHGWPSHRVLGQRGVAFHKLLHHDQPGS